MIDYTIVEAKTWHCGAMSRLLRLEHQKAVAMIGLNPHRQLREVFDDSTYRRAALVDGRLVALWGVAGPRLASCGLVWLAVASAVKKYPLALIKESRRQIDEMMQTRRVLVTSLLDGDEAAERFAIFLGFVPTSDTEYFLPAESHFGRKEIARQLKETDHGRTAYGTGYVRIMAYHQPEAT